jgi:hypothetical protein
MRCSTSRADVGAAGANIVGRLTATVRYVRLDHHVTRRVGGRRASLRVTSVAVAAVMLGAACTASSKRSGAHSSTGNAGATVTTTALTASARGVTPTTIRIGFAYPDLQALSKTGIVKIDVGPSADLMKAIVDDFDAHDSINGRKLELFTSGWFPIGNEKQLASCIELTEDHAVFAVLGGYLGGNNLCVTKQHDTALIGRDVDATATIRQSSAPWISAAPTGERAAAGLVRLMQQHGDLAGHQVAVMGQTIDQGLIDAAKQALVDAGVTPADVAVYEGNGSDTAALASEDRVFEQRLRSKHVDTIIDVSGYIPLNSFSKDGFLPRVFALSNAAVTAAAAVSPHANFPFVGTMTALSDPSRVYDDPTYTRCRRAWTAATGKTIKTPDEELKDGKSSGFGGMLDACTLLQLFVAAARAAGPNLTNDTLQHGVESLGRISLPSIGVATFRAGKLDGQNTFQLVELNKDWTISSTVQQYARVGDPITLTP